MSGVNWMRRKLQPMEREIARASIVLPTPGTSSISRCPSHSNASRVVCTSTRLPMMTFSTLSQIRSETALTIEMSAIGGKAPREF